MPSFFQAEAPQLHAVQEAMGGRHAAPGSHISEGSEDEDEDTDEDEDEGEDESTDDEEGAAALQADQHMQEHGDGSKEGAGSPAPRRKGRGTAVSCKTAGLHVICAN